MTLGLEKKLTEFIDTNKISDIDDTRQIITN